MRVVLIFLSKHDIKQIMRETLLEVINEERARDSYRVVMEREPKYDDEPILDDDYFERLRYYEKKRKKSIYDSKRVRGFKLKKVVD